MEFERFAILKLEAQSSKLEALNKAAAASPFSAASLTFHPHATGNNFQIESILASRCSAQP
jgi:hypothetical protein